MPYDPDTIFKAFRLVPEFDGNPNILPRFIKICDQIVNEFVEVGDPKQELARAFLANGILNKITGNAARIINSNGCPDDWPSIKSALINNFSDQRDETALYNDLMVAVQGNTTPQEFYDKCANLFSTIMTYVSLHETLATTIEAKRVLYNKLTLQAYVRGLKEPLGSRIRCMRPDSLQKALEFVQEETNVMYLQQRTDSLQDKKQSFNKPIQPSIAHTSNWPKPNPVPLFQWKPNTFNANNNSSPNRNFSHQPFYVSNMPTRTQQMFSAPPPNYNFQQNRFSMPQRNASQNQGPKPMSGVSHYVTRALPFPQPAHDWRKHGNPPPSNYFKTREMNFTECYDNYDSYYPDSYMSEGQEYFYPIDYPSDGYSAPFDTEQVQIPYVPDDYVSNELSDEPRASTSSDSVGKDKDFHPRINYTKPK